MHDLVNGLAAALVVAKGNAESAPAGVLLGIGVVVFYLWNVRRNRTK